MMSKHRDPKTVMRYDHGRENLDQNAVNFLQYEDEVEPIINRIDCSSGIPQSNR
jgi:hypothetical protein